MAIEAARAPSEAVGKNEKRPAQKWIGMFLKDKGGTGASLIARFLAELHETRETGAWLIDGDGTTASLSNHFGDPREHADPALCNASNPVRTFSLHGTERERDTIATLLESDATKILMDLPATSLTVVRRLEKEYGWTSLFAAYGWRPTIVASITPFRTSIFDLGDVIELFGDRAEYVACLNMGTADNDRSNFGLWDKGQTRKRFVDLGGTELVFPNLKKGILAELEVRPQLTFEAAKSSPRLVLTDRSRLHKWYADAVAAFEAAAARLGL